MISHGGLCQTHSPLFYAPGTAHKKAPLSSSDIGAKKWAVQDLNLQFMGSLKNSVFIRASIVFAGKNNDH